MKLAKLLGLGTSFFGGGQTAAYRLNKRGVLPKFNEGRNPFAPAAPAAASETTKTKADAPAEAPASKAAAPRVFKPAAKVEDTGNRLKPGLQTADAPAPSIFRPMAKTEAPGSRLKPGQQTAGASAKAAKPGWTMRLNPFRAPELPAQPPCAVQPELSLAGIKVIHNDLADADVEIVPVKARASAPTPAMLPPARQAWEYVGENLLKSS